MKAGQLLAEIDPADYETALAHAEASVAGIHRRSGGGKSGSADHPDQHVQLIATSQLGVTGARAALAAAKQNQEAAVARLREAEADNTVAQADLARYAALVQKEEVSRQQYDRQVAVAKSAEQTVEANRAAVAAAADQVHEAESRVQQAESTAAAAAINAGQQVAVQSATVQQKNGKAAEARAQLDQARLDLSYTKIFAPADGVVGRKNVEIGMRVQSGQELLAVVELSDIWITANFKETQLRQVRPGQAVSIHVDTFDADFDGYVESMPAATGAQFSLLPPENATGNYVKVVQRLPLRIRFKGRVSPDDRLRPGMSVETKIHLR